MPENADIAPCWCGQEHADNPLRGVCHGLLAALRLPAAVARLDGLLRRWPWLYRHLGGDTTTPYVCEVCGGRGVEWRGVWDYCPQGHTYVSARTTSKENGND